MRGCEEAIATALFELAEKAATRLRERACWQLPLSGSPTSGLGGQRRRPGTITMGGVWY